MNPAVLRQQNGTQFRGDDGDIHGTNSPGAGAGGLFQQVTGKYGKWPVCTRSRLVVYNQRAGEKSGRRTMAV